MKVFHDGSSTMILIIGAGIAGLSLGWQLVQSGADVTIIDKGKAGGGASGAAGAYLEPRPGKGKLRALEWASLDLWPEFAKSLERESGIDIGYRQDGVMYVAFPEAKQKLEQSIENHQASGWQVEELPGKSLQSRAPALSQHLAAGYILQQVHHLDAQKACQALVMAFIERGGRLIENIEGCRINNALEVHTAAGPSFMAEKIVIAAGHGTALIEGLPSDIPQSRPVRGVMVELQMSRKSPLVKNPLKSGNCILLPLSEGRLLVGSSHEEGEERAEAPQAVVNQLLEDAVRVVPEIADLPIIKTRAGIRALVGDGLLRLGCSNENRNIFYSLSHAGAGYLRAPVIARELAKQILDPGEEPNWIAPFYKI